MTKDSILLYGKNSVYERLKANPKSIKKIFFSDKSNISKIEKLIEDMAMDN